MATKLDNPIWHGLSGPLAHLAEASADGRARRFLPDVSPFSAVERVDDASWKALAELVGTDGIAVLVGPEVTPAPEGWTEEFRQPCHQMVAGDLGTAPPMELTRLGPDDVPEMLELVELTQPGPFRPRTIELGTYVGVRRQGRLLAMAGQRFRLPGWCEISAVCTHPDGQRQGLGAGLTLWMAQRIRQEGNEAFLHVLDTNVGARRLYERLGFRTRRIVEVVGNRWLADPARSERARIH